jgi:hypothetical protein
MRRYEACNGPMLDDPVCGRPANHPGRHRSQEAMARYSRAQAGRRQDKTAWWDARGRDLQRQRREGYRRAA